MGVIHSRRKALPPLAGNAPSGVDCLTGGGREDASAEKSMSSRLVFFLRWSVVSSLPDDRWVTRQTRGGGGVERGEEGREKRILLFQHTDNRQTTACRRTEQQGQGEIAVSRELIARGRASKTALGGVWPCPRRIWFARPSAAARPIRTSAARDGHACWPAWRHVTGLALCWP